MADRISTIMQTMKCSKKSAIGRGEKEISVPLCTNVAYWEISMMIVALQLRMGASNLLKCAAIVRVQAVMSVSKTSAAEGPGFGGLEIRWEQGRGLIKLLLIRRWSNLLDHKII